MAPRSSITKRWLLNSFGIIVVIMVAMVIGVSAAMHSFYYNSASQYIRTRAAAVSARLESAAADAGSDFNARLYELVQDFEYRDRIELMAIDSEGTVFLTSSGFLPQDTAMPDLADSRTNGGIGSFTGRWDGQKIMAVTVLSSLSGVDLLGLRYVVSMQAIDRQLTLITVFASLVALAILLFVLYTSRYFINSIIAPVGEVSRTARQIAQGDFDVRLDTHNDDEIGQLCDTINDMAVELGAAEKMKNDFISSVSHELRTPLTAIKGWAETMQGGGMDDETFDKGMSVIIRESERLSGIVEELLDFSRMQSGRMTLTMDKIDILAELGEAVYMFSERAKSEHKYLLYEEPRMLSPVLGDINRLRQVFVNILDNALKYTGEGGTISVVASEENGYIRVAISDNGCGIPPEHLPNVKKKFYKANQTVRGSGIGLALADEIMRLHSGSLEIESHENVGTVVTIRIPAFLEKAPDAAQDTERISE